MSEYHFGVPGIAIWISHILYGIFFIYVGYAMVTDVKLPKYFGVGVVVLGFLALLYHAHIWYYSVYHEYSGENK